MKLIKEVTIIFFLQIIFVTCAFGAEVINPYGILDTIAYENQKVIVINSYWDNTTEAEADRTSFPCPANTITINDGIQDANDLFNHDLWDGYFRECELDTGYVNKYYFLGCIGTICGSEDLTTTITSVNLDVTAFELIALQGLIGFAMLWGVRKLVKIMNRS